MKPCVASEPQYGLNMAAIADRGIADLGRVIWFDKC